jgi:hypothetical protein
MGVTRKAIAAWLAIVCVLAIGVSSAAHAQSGDVCGPLPAPVPVLRPVLAGAGFAPSESAIDCFMWQSFIYLNWPALDVMRGTPDTSASFDDGGPTVWETYKSYDAVFLPNAAVPAGWNDDLQKHNLLLRRHVLNPGPALRILNSVSKVFRSITGSKSENLDDIHQVDGGVLYDQNGLPVYYEMMMNAREFSYIVDNRLYDADVQYRFVQKSAIVLPAGSMEIKAAWKVLTPEEARAKPLRFHTVRGVLPGSNKPVTVGLVGHKLQPGFLGHVSANRQCAATRRRAPGVVFVQRPALYCIQMPAEHAHHAGRADAGCANDRYCAGRTSSQRLCRSHDQGTVSQFALAVLPDDRRAVAHGAAAFR